MTLSERFLQRRLKRAGSDKEAFDKFFLYCQDRIYSGGRELPYAFFQAKIREPWKTIAGAHQIWGWIGSDCIYQYLEDESMRCFDSVLQEGLSLLGLAGFEVIEEYRRRVETEPEFWSRKWHDHVFINLPATQPKLSDSVEADEVWQQYRALTGRFLDATRGFEARAGALLRNG